MKIVHEGFIRVENGGLVVEGFAIQDDEQGPASLQALAEYAWLKAMYEDRLVGPPPYIPPIPEHLYDHLAGGGKAHVADGEWVKDE